MNLTADMVDITEGIAKQLYHSTSRGATRAWLSEQREALRVAVYVARAWLGLPYSHVLAAITLGRWWGWHCRHAGQYETLFPA